MMQGKDRNYGRYFVKLIHMKLKFLEINHFLRHMILDTETQDPQSFVQKIHFFRIFDPKDTILLSAEITCITLYLLVFLEKYDFLPKSGKKPKFSFLPFFSKMIFLNICHRVSAKKIHFGHFGQVSGGR